MAARIEAFEMAFLNVAWSPDDIDREHVWNPDMYPSTPGVVI